MPLVKALVRDFDFIKREDLNNVNKDKTISVQRKLAKIKITKNKFEKDLRKFVDRSNYEKDDLESELYHRFGFQCQCPCIN